MMKVKKEEREIKGEVEGHGMQITPFPGNRGTRGIKVEGEWHNVLGNRNFLESLDKEFPRESFIKFIERQNKKGYWDVAEGSLRKITKQEAYNKDIRKIVEPQQQPAPVEEIENNNFSSTQQSKPNHNISLSRKDIEGLYKLLQQNPGIPRLKVPVEQEGIHPIKAYLVIDLNSSEGPKVSMKIQPTSKPDYLHALVLMLAHLDLAKDMVKAKIEECKLTTDIDIKSKSQDGKQE